VHKYRHKYLHLDSQLLQYWVNNQNQIHESMPNTSEVLHALAVVEHRRKIEFVTDRTVVGMQKMEVVADTLFAGVDTLVIVVNIVAAQDAAGRKMDESIGLVDSLTSALELDRMGQVGTPPRSRASRNHQIRM